MESKRIVTRKIKLLATVIIILAILIVIMPLCLYGYYKYKAYDFKKETYDYLYSKDYQNIEIKKVEVVIEKGTLLSSLVEFTDEPNVLYWYDKLDGQIVQIGIYEPSDETKFKHSEY